ncbi:VOC family protein [Sphingomonas sp. LaA6.9]|uniref:VOC family protein n=1 Tax=Sphingomonas sp. LaA6.9 TaxID=2919914 RepID=UPI001F503F6F|nr:VOC family protein [Sphingomonas sp. LaA6.9]MCJ8157388.1 VOC family protein [Sphingomonas sp. LaA6.9]
MTMASIKQAEQQYDVGGVLLERPFQITRLGHFGLTLAKFEEGVRFYTEILGFRISERQDVAQNAPAVVRPLIKMIKDRDVVMLRHNTEHHTLVLISTSVNDLGERILRKRNPVKEITTNQITWQVGSLAEVVNGRDYFAARGIRVLIAGRDMPGSNWHCYIEDSEGRANEIYYGIEQIGWDGRSKPTTLYQRIEKPPELPQPSEWQEIDDAAAAGVDLTAGHRDIETLPPVHEVDGILMSRPFKITRIGPVGLLVEDAERALQFYRDSMGFVETERVPVGESQIIYLRNNTEHHSLALVPIELRDKLGLSAHSTLAWFGLQLGNYRQLRRAIDFLRERGVTVRDDLTPGVHPGIDHAVWAFDPDGHCLLLYWSMDQVGWNGETRGARAPAGPVSTWPDQVPGRSDAFNGQVFLGPLA